MVLSKGSTQHWQFEFNIHRLLGGHVGWDQEFFRSELALLLPFQKLPEDGQHQKV